MKTRVPWWFTVLLVLLCVPMFSFVSFVAATPPGSTARILAWAYPVYVPLSAVCAWMCYPDRRELAWILTVLLALCDAGMWFLV